MKFIELSIDELERTTHKWFVSIRESYQPDLVIYIAQAGYLIGLTASETFGVPMVGINASRKGSNIKTRAGRIIKHMPNLVRNLAIFFEMFLGIHDKQVERHIEWLDDPSPLVKKTKSIILVDDSIDTGHTILSVCEAIHEKFGANINIKVCSLNVWSKSRKIVNVDFALHENTIIKSPMSKDSEYYDSFLEIYNNHKKCNREVAKF